MRTKKFFISLLILSLAVMITPLASAVLVDQAPIYIDGNSNFTPENGVSSGSGTESDPYIIENWNISSTSGACIEITNTDAYFIVRNCTLSGTSSTAVIVLNNVTNGRVEGNTVSGGSEGIRLSSSSSNTITNNTCNNTYHGILLLSSSSNTITNNTCTSDFFGIRLSSSSSNTITNNTCNNNTYGIHLEYYSSNNTLTNNTCNNNNSEGIHLESSSNTLTNNTCTGNYREGIYLLSSSSNNNILTNNTCNNNSEGIHLESSSSNILTNNTCNNNKYDGIYLYSSSNTITNNTCNNNTYHGIYLFSSSSNILTNNTCTNNTYGIYLYSSSSNTITNNTCTNNTYGIHLSFSTNNNITWNELMFNTINAYDNTAANLWEYNFYSDYTGPDSNRDRIGDIPYNITGGSNRDLHPLVDTEPPYFTSISPPSGSVAGGSGTIAASYADATSNVNASLCVLIVNGEDVTQYATFGLKEMSYDYTLPTGTCNVSVKIVDYYGNAAWHNWSFTVDATPPQITGLAPADGSCTGSAAPQVSAICSDGISGLGHVSIFVDGAGLSVSADGTRFYCTPVPLASGMHTAMVVARDAAGNVAIVTWSFTVDTTPPQVTGMSPASGALTNNSRPAISVAFSDATSGIAAASARILINGTDVTPLVTVTSSGVTYVPATALPDGIAAVTVTVSDNAGNEVTATWSFTVDTTPHDVSAISPANASLVAASSSVVAAQFSDLNGIDASSVALMIDGTDVTGSASVDGSGISVSVHLSEGAHTVGLTVADAAGNVAIVTWSFTVDTTPPQVTGMSPASGALTNNSRPAISVAFSDATSGIAAASARILINGTDVTPLVTVTSSGVTYVPATALPDGIAAVTVTVSDNAGNEVTATWSFTVDTRATLTISSPLANGSTVAAGAFQFNASFSGVGPLPGSVHLLIDGVDVTSNATVTATGISCSVTLPAGNHTITLQVTDAAGNTASASWTVNATEAAAGGGSDMTLVYVGIAVVVVILGAAAAYLAMRKR